MRCPQCRAELLEKTEICPYCGMNLSNVKSDNNDIKQNEFSPNSLDRSGYNKSIVPLIRLIICFMFIVCTASFIVPRFISSMSEFKNENITTSTTETTTFYESSSSMQDENDYAFLLEIPEGESQVMSPLLDIPLIDIADAKINLKLIDIMTTAHTDSFFVKMDKVNSDYLTIALNSTYINNQQVDPSSWISDNNGQLSSFFYIDNIKYEDVEFIDLLFDVSQNSNVPDVASYQIKVRIYENGYFGKFDYSTIL
jgi:hypothetical protein